MPETRSTTETLVTALRILSRDIQSDDGVANAAIAEAADRLEELAAELRRRDAAILAAIESAKSSGHYSCMNALRALLKPKPVAGPS